MSQILIQDVEQRAFERLKARAQQSGRSVQAEAKAILERVMEQDESDMRPIAARVRHELAQRGPQRTDSADLIAEDRQR